MKCSQCGTDNTKTDRANGKCKQCAVPFAFDPQRGDRVTDLAFRSAVDRVSVDGTVKFLPAHVRARLELNHARGHHRSLKVGFGVCAALSLALAFGGCWLPLLVVPAVALGVATLGIAGRWAWSMAAGAPVPTLEPVFDELWSRCGCGRRVPPRPWASRGSGPTSSAPHPLRRASVRSGSLDAENWGEVNPHAFALSELSAVDALLTERPEAEALVAAHGGHY